MPTLLEQVQDILIEELSFVDRAKCLPDKRLKEDLGADSLDEVQIVMTLESTFGIDIPDADAEQLRTVGDYVAYLERRAPRAA